MHTEKPQTITITKPDDFHLHVRDGEVLGDIVPHTARHFARALIMPNLKPPVVNVAQALAYRDRILAALELSSAQQFNPLMSLYLTDNTPKAEVLNVKNNEHVYAFKAYPAGATTNSDAGVTDLLGKCAGVLEELEKHQVPLLLHGEVTDPATDIFDREKIFIDKVLEPLLLRHPNLKIVFEHITTKDAVDYIMDSSAKIAATITPQHLQYNRNALFMGGVRPHWYCLPILKKEPHRQALLNAAISGDKRFFLGTDSAPHTRTAKENSCGCAGCFSALHAVSLYAEVFDEAGALDKLEGFASHFGADFYELSRNADRITLVKQTWTIPDQLSLGNDVLVPLAAGERLSWSVQDH